MTTRLAIALAAALAASTAAAQEPIRIGLSTPLSGTAANLGEHDKWGAELAVEEINAAGGLLGRKVVLLPQDNRCNPAESVKAAGKLINEDKVVALLGAMCSSSTLATMPIVQRERIPFVVAISTASKITEQSGAGGNVWTFKTNPTDSGLSKALLEFLARDRKMKRVAVVAEDTDYGRGGADAMRAAGKEHGIEITTADFFPQGTPDFTTLLTKLRAQRPDAIAIYALGADQINWFRQYVGFGMRVPMTGRVNNEEINKQFIGQGAVNGTTSVFPYDWRVDTAANKAFAEKYRAKHKVAPFYQSFYSYEATQILADAIRRAGSTDAEAIRTALRATRYASALGATIAFDANNQAHNFAVITEIREGDIKVVGLEGT
ncbi:MAG: ABC transporter substrate-binding protein [Alphaproteobacteria bacterium]|nr:ABC transporter substrate-binding protein [Alphaproteobacteria bacterium]